MKRVGENSILHSQGGRTPKYKTREETAPRACSCTGPTADQQCILKEMKEATRKHVII
jgi:hypothetical protein